jgi:hypothetical protein
MLPVSRDGRLLPSDAVLHCGHSRRVRDPLVARVDPREEQ